MKTTSSEDAQKPQEAPASANVNVNASNASSHSPPNTNTPPTKNRIQSHGANKRRRKRRAPQSSAMVQRRPNNRLSLAVQGHQRHSSLHRGIERDAVGTNRLDKDDIFPLHTWNNTAQKMSAMIWSLSRNTPGGLRSTLQTCYFLLAGTKA